MTHSRKRPSPHRAVRLPGDREMMRRMRELGWSRADLGPVDVLESMTDGFMALDRDWRITYVNAAAERTNGLTRDQLLGKTHWEAFPAVLGTEFESALQIAMTQRVSIRGENFYEPYGRWFEMDIHPLQNGGLAFLGRDITERKLLQQERDQLRRRLQLIQERKRSEQSLRASEARLAGELAETTERLRLSERMASLGTLAAGLGHDMGNLLLPLDIRLDLLLQADLPRDLHEHVLGIQKCARYLQRLSSGLRLLATDPLARSIGETTELGTWWNDIGMILKDALPGEIRLDHRLPPHECWVAIGRTGLTQAVFNVVQNAADALKQRGSGLVTIEVEDDPKASEVTVRIADDGPGMTDEVARHCMEPYFSTKARGESTGMGLAFVHGLVTGIGGGVEINGGLGRGTIVTLTLPRARPEQRAEATAAGARLRRPRVPRASTS